MFGSLEEVMAWLHKDETQHGSSSVSDRVSAPVNAKTYPTGKYTKLITAVKAEQAMRAIFGIPDLSRNDECIFDVLEREAREGVRR